MHDQSHFPEGEYTPFGYLDNPYHSAIINRSGLVRSVPPLGFGFWARPVPFQHGPFSYGDRLGHRRIPNYLSILHLSLNIDGSILHNTDDFKDNDIKLVSHYHTKLMFSYNFEYQGILICARYMLVEEDSIVCILNFNNQTSDKKSLIINATNIYGYHYMHHWGCVGMVTNYNAKMDIGVQKQYGYGDVFVVGADRKSIAHKALISDDEWNEMIRRNNLSNIDDAQIRYKEGNDHVINVLSYQIDLFPKTTDCLTLSLTRGKNENWTAETHFAVIKAADGTLKQKLTEDAHFYNQAAFLSGDWPEHWKNGWIYDLETIRMNIRPPLGIYKHHWDAMQVHSPRVVLSETSLDSMCLSYADMELAKEVILGTFKDAPEPNVPCSREDGSVNMICASGKECGMAPNFGLPFLVIHSMYLRNGDDFWIKQLYPYLKAYIEWWLKNRTDEDGWFHVACSWESGQDGSVRFLMDSDDCGAPAEFVRNVDIEAALAAAMKNMELYAKISGEAEDAKYWKKLADKRILRTRSMFHDGWYRDFDARNNRPIILENVKVLWDTFGEYYNVMMLAPVALNIATKEQIKEIKPKFEWFKKNHTQWDLAWPPSWQVFTEAAWYAEERSFIAEFLWEKCDVVYARTNSREPYWVEVEKKNVGLPEKYCYRSPGIACENWPVDYKKYLGAENYGWGATLPTLIVRNIIGFRESDNVQKNEFILAPSFPADQVKAGEVYQIKNLN